MQFVFDDGAEACDVEAVMHDPDAVVADLIIALGGHADSRLFVDGREVPGDRRLDRARILDGAVLRLRPSDDAVTNPPGEPAVVLVEVIGGLDAGHRSSLPSGSWSIGRRGADLTVSDPAISAVHASIDVARNGSVTLTDRDSLNGSWTGDVPIDVPTVIGPDTIVRLGATQLQVGPPVIRDRSSVVEPGPRFAANRTLPFNRPPRVLPLDRPEPLETPEETADVPAASAVGIISVIAPVVLGLVMVRAFHNWFYGLFALLGPVMLVGQAIESKRRVRKTRRRDRIRYAHQLRAFRTRLADLAAAERERRLERFPAPPEIVRRATGPSSRLWERRPAHDDFLRLRAGLGQVRWDPPVEGTPRRFGAEVRQAIADASRLSATPVAIDLSAGGVAGLFGPRRAVLALARSLVAQAATLHGPADLPLAVVTARDRSADWDWTKWLPHTIDRSGSGLRMLARDPDVADQLLRDLLDHAPAKRPRAEAPDTVAGPTLLLVIDDESVTEGRRAPARSVLRGLAGPVGGIVIASSEDRLPAVCTTVVEVINQHGEAVVHRPATGQHLGDVLIGGMADRTARLVARALARFEDPELDVAGAGLPATVGLLPLLGVDPPTVDAVLQRWRDGGTDPDLMAPIGVAEDGVLALDLVRDGPHGLVAGTTGSGKSELLRSLVASLATGCSPAELTFVLIDFKGGSAFDQCARLPHTVGMVTDLDERLGARALRCLEAELRWRERSLRHAGAADLHEYRRLIGHPTPIPRLVVVIDEFATLHNELPDFVDSLVGIAQRGRSLGVHLVLATQRPAGAVSENIRANMNLRVALRVQDTNDSLDVIDLPDAASIGRNQPGRALVRLGPGEVVAIQTALSTGLAATAGHPPVEVRPFRFAPIRRPSRAPSAGTRSAITELTRLVDVIGKAFVATGQPAPRRPWPEPLPDQVDLDVLVDAGPASRFGEPGATLTFALADLPDHQLQQPAGWSPCEGNLLLIGVGGSGTTTALSSIALAAARTSRPDDLHLYVLDFGAGALAPLARLPHTGAVIAADDRERQTRLMRLLKAELSRRRALPDSCTTEPRILVVVDGMAGFRAAWDETDVTGMFDDLVRVFADGVQLGLHLAISADRPGAVPNAISALARQRLIFRLGESLDAALFGLASRDIEGLTPGAAVMADSRTEIRIGRPAPDLATAVGRLTGSAAPATDRPPPEIQALPTHVDPLDLVAAARLGDDRWFIPVGIGDSTLDPVGFTLHDGEHALIAGPPRSGRTTALQTVACVVRARSTAVTIVAIAGPRSALRAMSELDRVVSPESDRDALDALADIAGPVLVLVDDAELMADGHDGMQRVLDRRRHDLHVVAAGRSEALRSLYVHWTRSVRASRSGLLLEPDPDLDGDLFGTRLPRRSPVTLSPGRGYVVAGSTLEALQVAGPSWGTD